MTGYLYRRNANDARMQFDRRTLVRTLGAGVALGSLGGTASARRNGNGRIDRLLSTGEPVPENLAFDADGNLYVGLTGGSVRRVDADETDETGLDIDDTTEVAAYPDGVAGVLVREETLYTAVNGDPGGGVYAVDLGGEDPTPTELATILPEGNGFVNDLYADADGDRLLVTESFGGTAYEVPLGGDPEASAWIQDDLLDTESFGANGITRVDDDVFVNVTRATDAEGTDVGRIVRVPVEDDGSAGEPETYLEGEELFGADGLTARGPRLYVAVNAADRISRVTPSGNLRTVVEGGPLSFPSEVVFDPTERGKLFVCNFSPEAPDAAGVLRLRP